MAAEMNHFDEKGNAVMVDVSGKEPTSRTAVAEGKILVSKEIMEAVTGHTVKKGDVLAYVHANTPESANNCVEEIKKAYVIGYRRISKKNIIEII